MQHRQQQQQQQQQANNFGHDFVLGFQSRSAAARSSLLCALSYTLLIPALVFTTSTRGPGNWIPHLNPSAHRLAVNIISWVWL